MVNGFDHQLSQARSAIPIALEHTSILIYDTNHKHTEQTIQTATRLHLNPLHLHAPRIRRHVQRGLHRVRDGLPVRQDLRQVLGAEDVAEGGHGEEPGRVAVVGHLDNGVQRVLDPVVDHGVDCHCHRVLGEGLESEPVRKRLVVCEGLWECHVWNKAGLSTSVADATLKLWLTMLPIGFGYFR